MKKTILISILALFTLISFAQYPATKKTRTQLNAMLWGKRAVPAPTDVANSWLSFYNYKDDNFAIISNAMTYTATVASTDTVVIKNGSLWKKSLVSKISSIPFSTATYTTSVRPTDTVLFKVGANYYKSLYSGFHNVIGTFDLSSTGAMNLAPATNYSLSVSGDFYEKRLYSGTETYSRTLNGDEVINSIGHYYSDYVNYLQFRANPPVSGNASVMTHAWNYFQLGCTNPSYSITLSSPDGAGSTINTFQMKSTGIVISTPTLTIPTGAGLNKVLTSDASGVATWQTPTSGWALNGNTVGSEKSFGTLDNYEIPVIQNNTERMRITSNTIKIGSAFNVDLYVGSTKSIVLSPKIFCNGQLVISDGGTKGMLMGYNGNDIQGRSGATLNANDDLVLNGYSGNVAIGNFAPTQKFEVSGGSITIIDGFLYMKDSLTPFHYWKGTMTAGALVWTDTGSATKP